MESPALEGLTGLDVLRRRDVLVVLLQEVVGGGASVGFMPPLAETEAATYWDGVAAALKCGGGRLWIACGAEGGIAGTPQLDLASQANGRHRAEVVKLMVLSSAGRRGIGRALKEAAEVEARSLERTTLVLDTRPGTLHTTAF